LTANTTIRRAQVHGAFTGFNGDVLFKLTDGTHWLQAEYKYWYYYSYRPEVELFTVHGATYLRVVGRSESVAVRQVTEVIESQIVGAFNGWQGDSEYQLTNGQVWKQLRYHYEYQYKHRPTVMIYNAPSGTVMDVDGCRATVRRVR
jgi:hypothetical protein